MPDRFTALFADQANDVLGAILDQSVECIKLVNLAGELEYVNRNGLAMLEIDSFELLAGKPWSEMWPEGGRDRVDAALCKARRGQRDRFDGYCPTFAGEPRWWDVSVSPIVDDRGVLTHILATSRDITDRVHEKIHDKQLRDEAQRSAERSDSVAREMRHRLKNQLAVVSSVAKLLARHSLDARDLMDRLEIKLQALARAQDLLIIHRDAPPEAAQAIEQVLEASGAGDNISVGRIPYALIGDDAIQQLALILGELQTNSLKYGSLSSDQGLITISASAHDRVLSVVWHEDCGRKVEAPKREGSGVKLLTRLGSVSGQSAQIHWHPRGPQVTFHIRTI